MKIIIFILIFWASAATLAAQTACPPELFGATVLRGLKLGMTPAEVQAVFGRDLRVKVKTRGTRSFFQNYITEKAKGILFGVRALYLRFHEGRLYQIEIFYEENAGFRSLADLTSDFAKQNNFPPSVWQIAGGNRAEISCEKFSIRANNILNPYLELTDENELAKVEAERKK